MLHDLYTARAENLTGTPWTVYPRPQMRRDSWLNLNGEWDFAVNEPVFDGKTIRLPFCPESLLSGVKTHYPEGTPLYYRRKVTLPETFNRGRVLLHIGAADQIADVFVNGTAVCHHEGGYEAFCADITQQLQPENEIMIRCTDDLNDQAFPYGKQVKPEKRGGMWYTPVSGIWQTVWLESVPETYIRELNMENRGNSVTISIQPALNGKVTVAGLGEYTLENGSITITPENPRLWSPEEPYLYDITLEAGGDRIESYFALRTLEIKTVKGWPRLCLNGKPYFFHGLLDQGYWPEGIFTPAAPECYADDILAMKKLGFNTLRKHIKVEPEQFYYDCDRLGMIVFQDFVNNGDYNFIRDTALPTVGLKARGDRNLHRDPKTRSAFLTHMEQTVQQLWNHPSVCYWTIFNEGWGQFDSTALYRHLKALDSTRIVDSASGWFTGGESDVVSDHVYFKPFRPRKTKKPLVLSEFGGYAWKVPDHAFDPDHEYGYRHFEDQETFEKALVELYEKEIVPAIPKGLCGAIYTQLSDVEDETNGLVTYDRKVMKVDPKVMMVLAEKLKI